MTCVVEFSLIPNDLVCLLIHVSFVACFEFLMVVIHELYLRALGMQGIHLSWNQKDLQSIHPEFQNLVSMAGIFHVFIHMLVAKNFRTLYSSDLSLLYDSLILLSSEIHVPRNISCPVSPIGSPLLYPRSPQHLNGRMSPSPISSPLAASCSSTPLSGGNGAIPFHHFNQSIYLQEGIANLSQCLYINAPSYWEPDASQGMQSGAHTLWDLQPTENDALANQFGRPTSGEFNSGQSVLANRVSQQLLRDHVKLIPPLDLNPCHPLSGRTGGT